MKRYFIFLRSMATVSLGILYSLTTLVTPHYFVQAEAPAFVSEEVVWEQTEQTTEITPVVESPIDHEEEETTEVFFVETDSSQEALLDSSLESQETIVEEIQEEQMIEEIAPAVASACATGTAPTITFESFYADTNQGGADALLMILSQIGATATDVEDGTLAVSNNLADFYPFTSGWHTVTFSAQDSDGCITETTTEIFVFGDDFSPVCESGYVYVRGDFGDTLQTVLGTNSIVESNQWFPVMIGGQTLSENEHDITAPHDISIARVGTTLFINVSGTEDDIAAAEAISETLEISGGVITSNLVLSGGVIIVDFAPTDDCPVEVCTPENGPEIVSLATETVTVQANTTLSHDEILDLFGLVAEDADGEGSLSIVSNLDEITLETPGTYTLTLTITDNEGCSIEQILSLVVEGDDSDDDDDENGGGGGSGCINPNGCGGNGNDDEEEPEGEILGASTCTPYLTTFMQMGQPNLKEDVERLQTFLNEYMGENLVVDGIYGIETFEAVKRFQMQEFDEILKPWGITEPTGIARETTTRHINNIMCPELNIQMPILYCATTGNLLYPDGTIADPNPEYILYNGQPVIKTWVITPEVKGEGDYRYEK